MKRKMLSRIVAVTMCSALLLAGCGSSGSGSGDSKDSGAPTEDGAAASELHVALAANPPSLDPPSVNSNIVGGIGVHVYESLFAMNQDYEPTPVLAESYEVSEDGMVYTIDRKSVV